MTPVDDFEIWQQSVSTTAVLTGTLKPTNGVHLSNESESGDIRLSKTNTSSYISIGPGKSIYLPLTDLSQLRVTSSSGTVVMGGLII